MWRRRARSSARVHARSTSLSWRAIRRTRRPRSVSLVPTPRTSASPWPSAGTAMSSRARPATSMRARARRRARLDGPLARGRGGARSRPLPRPVLSRSPLASRARRVPPRRSGDGALLLLRGRARVAARSRDQAGPRSDLRRPGEARPARAALSFGLRRPVHDRHQRDVPLAAPPVRGRRAGRRPPRRVTLVAKRPDPQHGRRRQADVRRLPSLRERRVGRGRRRHQRSGARAPRSARSRSRASLRSIAASRPSS